MNKLNNKGFTLIELLAVIVILAIVMVIALPNVLQAMNNSKVAALNTYSKRAIQKAGEYVVSQQVLNPTLSYNNSALSDSTIGLENNNTFSACVVVNGTSGGGFSYNVYVTYRDKSYCYVNTADADVNSGATPSSSGCPASYTVNNNQCVAGS